MPELEKIRLNASKRQALKKEWANTVYNKMPLQVDEDLKEAQENYRTVRSDVWDKVITPQVEKSFPTADMEILQKYSGTSHYNRFTDTDSCFYFKPQFNDSSEQQFKFTMNTDEYLALYHKEVQAKGHQATIKVEYDETQKQENPHYNMQKHEMSKDFASIAKDNGTYEDFALFTEGRDYGWTENAPSVREKDFAMFRKVVVSGSCHSRCMMLDSESDWLMLKEFEKAKSMLTNAHRELWKEKYQLITDMNSIIDQAKFLVDVQQYWTNVSECVNFENNEISRELSIVSDDTKSRLFQAINNIDTGKPDTVVVANQNFSMVN